MKKLLLKLKTLFPTLLIIFLFSYPAHSHPSHNTEHGMSHALFSSEHCLFFIFIGILVGLFMLSRNKILSFIGNLALLVFLIYQVVSHSLSQDLLFGLEFLLIGGFLSLAAWRATYWIFELLLWAPKTLRRIPHQNLRYLDNLFRFPQARAHCDIPCKIYDPAIATISALSVIRLIDIINETISMEDKSSANYENTMARCILRKEEESEKLKHEIRIIWGDYFKTTQFEAFPEIHDLSHQIMMLASAAKQKVNRKEAEDLLELVNKFSEIFWSTKEVETERKVAPYPPNLEIVRPKL